MAALFLLPAGLAVLTTGRQRPRSPSLGSGIHAGVSCSFRRRFCPLVALLYASGMIQDEQEEQTITYLLVRPLPKWALCLVKLLAIITTAVLLTAVFTLGLCGDLLGREYRS